MRQSRKVYGLFDPRDDTHAILYVGCTAGTVDNRLSMHITAAANTEDDTPILEWIRTLLKEGLEPGYMVLERADGENWEAREAYWIARYAGPNLLNVASGGKGSPGAKRTEEYKKRVGDFFRGKPLSEEHKAKLSAAKMGHVMPEHVKEALLKANLGRKHSEEHKAKRSAAMQGFRHTDEAKAKISAAHKGRNRGALPDEVKAKLANKIASLVWITNGAQNRRIPKVESIPAGWRTGRAGRPLTGP